MSEVEMTKRYLQIRNFHTDEIASKIDVTGKSERHIERAEMGFLMQADTKNWCIEVVEEEHLTKGGG